jgi:hypothetical protein
MDETFIFLAPKLIFSSQSLGLVTGGNPKTVNLSDMVN